MSRAQARQATRCSIRFVERMPKARPTRVRLGCFRRAEAIQFKQVAAGPESRQFIARRLAPRKRRRLDVTQFSDDDEEGQVMKKLFFATILFLGLTTAASTSAQGAGASKSQDHAKQAQPTQDAPPPTTPQSKRLTIEVTAGNNDVVVEA